MGGVDSAACIPYREGGIEGGCEKAVDRIGIDNDRPPGGLSTDPTRTYRGPIAAHGPPLGKTFPRGPRWPRDGGRRPRRAGPVEVLRRPGGRPPGPVPQRLRGGGRPPVGREWEREDHPAVDPGRARR